VRARTIAKPRLGCCPPSRRHSSRCQTARFAASAAQHISFPRRIFRARVVASRFFVSTAFSAACAGASAGSRPNPWRQLQLRPRNEGAGGAPGGALPVVALVGRDATLARRGASRAKPGPRLSALHRGVVSPGTAPDAPIPAIRPVGCSRPAIVHGGLRHRAFRSTALRAAIDATPRSACWIVSGDAPHERGWQSIYHLHYVVNT
jgi:hypothetical protein